MKESVNKVIAFLYSAGNVIVYIQFVWLSTSIFIWPFNGVLDQTGTTDFYCQVTTIKMQRTKFGFGEDFFKFTKTFDTGKRQVLWDVLLQLGCPAYFVSILHLLCFLIP